MPRMMAEAHLAAVQQDKLEIQVCYMDLEVDMVHCCLGLDSSSLQSLAAVGHLTETLQDKEYMAVLHQDCKTGLQGLRFGEDGLVRGMD